MRIKHYPGPYRTIQGALGNPPHRRAAQGVVERDELEKKPVLLFFFLLHNGMIQMGSRGCLPMKLGTSVGTLKPECHMPSASAYYTTLLLPLLLRNYYYYYYRY